MGGDAGEGDEIGPGDLASKGVGADQTAALGKGTRAVALLGGFQRAADLARTLEWRGAVVIRDGRLLVEQDGALFDAQDEPRFFREAGRGIARPMRKRLEERRLPVRTVFDVGANIGEVAICFARRYPRARVFAFEPAPENLERLDANVALQADALANLTVVREAVSDRRGEIEVAVGADRRNTVMLGANLDRLAAETPVTVARLPTDTLEGYCDRFAVDEIDFLKVDIEGGEPLLGASVRRLAGRIRAAVVEISRFNRLEAYLELVDAFAAGGLRLEDGASRPVTEPAAYLEEQLRRGPTTDAWFLPGP